MGHGNGSDSEAAGHPERPSAAEPRTSRTLRPPLLNEPDHVLRGGVFEVRGGVFVGIQARKEEISGYERTEEKVAAPKAPAFSIAQIAVLAQQSPALQSARSTGFYERLNPAAKVRGTASCWGALAKGDGATVRREKPAKMRQRLVALWVDSAPANRPRRDTL